MDNVKIIWDNCLQYIKNNINAVSFKTWFKPIIPLRIVGNILTVQVPSPFFFEYLEGNYIGILREALQRELGTDAKLEYNVVLDASRARTQQPHHTGQQPAATHNSGTYNVPSKTTAPSQPGIMNPFATQGVQKMTINPQLNPNYTMDNFVEGECNKLGRSAAESIAHKPGNTFNPFMIFGNSGLGKTHLAQAIGNAVKERFPEKVVLYVEANKFQTQYSDACRNNTRNDFIHFYQMLDLLIIDDVQEFAGKTGTQDTFFAIFNTLHQSGKQIILTCDTKPADLKGLTDRIITRFRWGLTVEVTVPDYITRLSILKRKVYNDGMNIPEEILEYIAKNVVSNVRELEGALISLLAHSTFGHTTLTLDVAKQLLGTIVKGAEPPKYKIENIIKSVCAYFSIKEQVLNSKSRAREIATARQMAMYFAKKLTDMPYQQIGIAIGGRDHSTVLHACKAIAKQIENDEKFKIIVDEVEDKIKQMNE
jgi:chromosomal replication initiator protein